MAMALASRALRNPRRPLLARALRTRASVSAWRARGNRRFFISLPGSGTARAAAVQRRDRRPNHGGAMKKTARKHRRKIYRDARQRGERKRLAELALRQRQSGDDIAKPCPPRMPAYSFGELEL